VPTIRLNVLLKYLKRDEYIPDNITNIHHCCKLPNFPGSSCLQKVREEDPPICPNSFYENLKISIGKRSLDDEEADLPKWA
jgi:hypothetical protein